MTQTLAQTAPKFVPFVGGILQSSRKTISFKLFGNYAASFSVAEISLLKLTSHIRLAVRVAPVVCGALH